MNKKLKKSEIELDYCMDADDLGSRITSCVNKLESSDTIVNVVILKINKAYRYHEFSSLLETVVKSFSEVGAKNCLFIPAGEHLPINDVDIKYVVTETSGKEVTDVTENN